MIVFFYHAAFVKCGEFQANGLRICTTGKVNFIIVRLYVMVIVHLVPRCLQVREYLGYVQLALQEATLRFASH